MGLANAGSTINSVDPKPAKTAGEKVTDEGEGGSQMPGLPRKSSKTYAHSQRRERYNPWLSTGAR